MKRHHWVEIGLLVLLLVAVVLCSVRLIQDNERILGADTEDITYIPLAEMPLSEEPVDSGGAMRKTYAFTLPADGSTGDCLAMYITQQYCTVTIDGETRFSYTDTAPHVIRASGNYWTCIRLSTKDLGKPVLLQLTPVYDYAPSPEIRICTIDRLFSDVLIRDLPLLLLGLMCVIQGVTVLILALFSITDRRTMRTLLSLAMLTIMAGVWKIADLPAATLVTRASSAALLQPKAISLFGMIAFLLMLVFTVQYIAGMRRNNTLYPDSVCVIAVELIAFVLLMLQCMGKLELHRAIPFFMTETAVLMLVVFHLILQRKGIRWLICFPLCAGADLLITRLCGSARYAVVLMVCILVSDYVSGVMFVRRTIRQKTELRDARTTALLNQIRPHFIHNTLTSIYYLCDSDPQTAKQLVRNFNKHLRASFTSMSAKTPIRFEEEIENVRAYLSVEQMRFSDKLFVEYDTPHTSFRLPALTVQPLVENAVKHNVDSGKPPVHIRIRSYAADGGSYIVIEDDGGGFDAAAPQARDHVGLQNVADRLDILCDGTLTVSPRPEGGTVVTVFVPDAAE